jgi:hypothetical protein
VRLPEPLQNDALICLRTVLNSRTAGANFEALRVRDPGTKTSGAFLVSNARLLCLTVSPLFSVIGRQGVTPSAFDC